MTEPPLRPSLQAALAELRREAAGLRRYGAEPQAIAVERACDVVEAAMRAELDAVLTLEEASRESRYSSDHIRHLVADGTLPNVGRKGAPRVRRADLPRRAPHRAAGGYDPDADALQLAARHTR
jgi:hypothetical protein